MISGREERERLDVPRADDAEVTAVEGRKGRGTEAFSQGDDGRVDRAEPEVGVRLDELGHAFQVSTRERLELHVSARCAAEESRLRLRPERPRDQVAGLGEPEGRNDERALGIPKELKARGVIRVVADGRSDEDARIYDERDGSNPSASSCSSARRAE